MKKNKYWYYITYYECPVCGRGDVLRERRYTPRPENYYERNDYVQYYDYCDVFI